MAAARKFLRHADHFGRVIYNSIFGSHRDVQSGIDIRIRFSVFFDLIFVAVMPAFIGVLTGVLYKIIFNGTVLFNFGHRGWYLIVLALVLVFSFVIERALASKEVVNTIRDMLSGPYSGAPMSEAKSAAEPLRVGEMSQQKVAPVDRVQFLRSVDSISTTASDVVDSFKRQTEDKWRRSNLSDLFEVSGFESRGDSKSVGDK